MIKQLKIFLPLMSAVAMSLFTGCGNSGVGTNCITPASIGSDAGLGAAGALLAYELSNGNKYWTLGGAAGGVVASKALQYLYEKEIEAAYKNGYNEAMNQSVKQQYWIMQTLQKSMSHENEEPHYAYEYIPIKIPETEINGEIVKERLEYIRVER